MNEKDIAEQAYANGYDKAVDELKEEIRILEVQLDLERTRTLEEWLKIKEKHTADKIFRQVLRLYQGLSKAERETMAFEWKLLDLAVEYGVEVE